MVVGVGVVVVVGVGIAVVSVVVLGTTMATIYEREYGRISG